MVSRTINFVRVIRQNSFVVQVCLYTEITTVSLRGRHEAVRKSPISPSAKKKIICLRKIVMSGLSGALVITSLYVYFYYTNATKYVGLV